MSKLKTLAATTFGSSAAAIDLAAKINAISDADEQHLARSRVTSALSQYGEAMEAFIRIGSPRVRRRVIQLWRRESIAILTASKFGQHHHEIVGYVACVMTAVSRRALRLTEVKRDER